MEQNNIVGIRENRRYQILTPSGFQNFKGIRKLQKQSKCKVSFAEGGYLIGSTNHKVLLYEEGLTELEKLKTGNKVQSPKGPRTVSSIEIVESPTVLYDAVEVEGGHLYITNGVVSRNCDADFLTSGNSVFDIPDIQYFEETYQADPVERRGVDGNYWIWERPDYTRTYLLSADVARGDGSDYSAFHIWDVETCTQVAEFKGKMLPKDYGAFLTGAAMEYNNALLVCENANIGWATIEEILSRNYPNLYYSVVGGDTNETAESYLSKSERNKTVPGFTTSPRTRPLVIAKYYDYIHTKSCVIRSKRLLTEMRTFIWSKTGKAEAQQGLNDDLVMSAGIGLYVRDHALKLRQQGLDLSRSQLGAFSTLNRRDPVIVQPKNFVNPYEMKNPLGKTEDISWLL